MTPKGPKAEVYPKRRQRALAAMDQNSVLFIAGPAEAVYSNDVCYRYRPDTNIRYLTGYEDPACLMLGAAGLTLFVEARDAERARWTGPRPGPEGAAERYGAEQGLALDQWPAKLEEALGNAPVVYYDPSLDPRAEVRVRELLSASGAPELRPARELLGQLRVIKEEAEIRIMREAIQLSAQAHRSLAGLVRPGMSEYEAEAAIDHEFRRGGCAGPAYPTIAASGANATVLHYIRNDRTMNEGDLLLVDAGGEYGGYCADITRTIPVGDSYSGPQREVYETVLTAQKSAIDAVRPGVTYGEVHMQALASLVPAMIEIGLLEGSVDECMESRTYTDYYMHRTSHWLGMDVHDLGSYGQDGDRPLEPGMVLTVEPGIYVSEGADCPEHLRGIGVRIEDDLLVTDNGAEVLSAVAPKETAEIEELRGRALA